MTAVRKGSAGYARRTFAFEARVAGEGAETTIEGHAAVFNSLSEPLGWFGEREIIAPGAFDEALRRVERGEDDVYALLNHDESFIIGGTRNGSLQLSVDEKGLFTRTKPLDTQAIRDFVVAPMRAGLLRKMSFGFRIGDEHVEKREGEPVWVIDTVERLFDISPVTFPAYPATDVEARGVFAALGIDPAKLSSTERLAVRSFIESMSRHLPGLVRAAGDCAREGCGHPSSYHADGTGACDQNDGCEAYLEPSEASSRSRIVTAAAAQGGRARDAGVALTGVSVELLRRRLDLHQREFNAGTPLN